MMRKVYVHARCELMPGDPEPDYRSLFSVMEARRMGRLLKRAVWTSAEALKSRRPSSLARTSVALRTRNPS